MRLQADIFFWLATCVATGIAMIVLVYVFGAVFAAFKTQPQIASNANAVKALNEGQTGINILANALVIIFVVMGLASCILSFFVNSSPVFLIIIFIILPIEILVAFIFHDVFFSIVNQTIFGATAIGIPSLVVFFQWLPVICLVFSGFNAIITFAKR